MKNSINTACDFCLSVLEGKQGTAEIKKPYISFRGTICYHQYDENGRHLYTYGQDKNDITEKHFCFETTCLQEYLKARQVLIERSIQNRKDIFRSDMGYGDYSDQASA